MLILWKTHAKHRLNWLSKKRSKKWSQLKFVWIWKEENCWFKFEIKKIVVWFYVFFNHSIWWKKKRLFIFNFLVKYKKSQELILKKFIQNEQKRKFNKSWTSFQKCNKKIIWLNYLKYFSIKFTSFAFVI